MQPLAKNTTSVPAFLAKLWNMVNDPETDHLICWGPSGTSFTIPNQAQFWYELLPLNYKHNNMSSFVRQLNMYGFHKNATVENGTMDAEKDEIQFSHTYFIRGQPELLCKIKRKTASPKAPIENNNKPDNLTRVLNDVKQLRGRQSSVDNQLNAMKQENGLLWREIAILRQKHIKQQKIVNKLIQFLVTLVQPSRMPGVKRGYQLMLNESPTKKIKTTNNQNSDTEGPTIHELDNELEMPSNLYGDPAIIVSPATSVASQITNSNSTLENPNENELQWEELDDSDKLTTDFEINTTTAEKVFLNPSTQNTLISNFGETDSEKAIKKTDTEPKDMTVAKKKINLIDFIRNSASTSNSYSSDLNNHIETTDSELEQFKDILNGYGSFDANALLGELNKNPQSLSEIYLFNDSAGNDLDHVDEEKGQLIDPLVSGSELTPYVSNFDFATLLDDSIDDSTTTNLDEENFNTLLTPQLQLAEPMFGKQKKK